MSYSEESRAMDAELTGGPDRLHDREAKSLRSRQVDGRPPVERALERCDEAVTRALELAEGLHSRLGPVLGPERPEAELGEVRGDSDLSPLAGRLEALADHISAVAAQLSRTTRRIEL